MRLAEEHKGGKTEPKVLFRSCFVMSVRLLNNCVEKVVLYLSLELSGKVMVLDINLEIIGIKLIFKIIRLFEIT